MKKMWLSFNREKIKLLLNVEKTWLSLKIDRTLLSLTREIKLFDQRAPTGWNLNSVTCCNTVEELQSRRPASWTIQKTLLNKELSFRFWTAAAAAFVAHTPGIFSKFSDSSISPQLHSFVMVVSLGGQKPVWLSRGFVSSWEWVLLCGRIDMELVPLLLCRWDMPLNELPPERGLPL